jgi:hypothetical protein
MRLIMLAGVLTAAAFAGSSAQAQSGYEHHAYCLMTGSAQECAYDTMAKCEASKRGSGDFCEQNTAPINHPRTSE